MRCAQFVVALLTFIGLVPVTAAAQAARPVRDLLAGSRLADGIDLGVDTSGRQREWVSIMPGAAPQDTFLKLAYPANQSWGVVYLTVGPVAQRNAADVSQATSLEVELRGEPGTDAVKVGLRDLNTTAGNEPQVPIRVTPEWKVTTIPLARFAPTNVRRLLVVAELVFSGNAARTVYLRKVRFAGDAAAAPVPRPATERRVAPPPPADDTRLILVSGAILGHGMDLGVDSASAKRDWQRADRECGCLAFSYPGDDWGAAFVTPGKAAPAGQRRPTDVSKYRTLVVEMKGSGSVEIGMKDATQPDDGSERKLSFTLTDRWESHRIALSDFVGMSPSKAYTLVEFVFGAKPVTLFVRNAYLSTLER